MRQSFPLFALLLLVSACTTMPANDECAANAFCSARRAEPRALADARGLAERKGDVLTIHPTATPAFRFTDHTAACEAHDVKACDSYALMASNSAAHALVVQQFLYEGSAFFLIDTVTGRQTQLFGMPAFSPDGRRFLVAPFDLEHDTGPNHLEIWRRDGDGAVLEWAHTFQQAHDEDPDLPEAYQTQLISWQGRRLRLQFSTIDGRTWRGTLTDTPAGWRLEAKSPPGLFAQR
jgi:hypothetical protein